MVLVFLFWKVSGAGYLLSDLVLKNSMEPYH